MTGTTPPRLTLYFIADNPGKDDNRDLLAWASSSTGALADWRRYYGTADVPSAGIIAIPTHNPKPGVVPWDQLHAEVFL